MSEDLKGLAEFNYNLGFERPRVINIHEDDESVTKLIIGSEYEHGSPKQSIRDFKKPSVAYEHLFYTIKGLLDFLSKNDALAGNPVMIFISRESIRADLAYREHRKCIAKVILDKSEEFNALCSMLEGITQKALWRLLINQLDMCVEAELLLQISQIKIWKGEKGSIQIGSDGIVNKQGESFITLDIPDTKGSYTMKIKSDWTWNGRIWEAFEKEYTIKLRLELDTDCPEGLKFIFHPRHFERTLMQARQDLVETIRTGVPLVPGRAGAQVYDGVE